MLLNSHPGAKYGIPFPVLARASFGVLGANVAAVLRALVACGWFGIQAWIGGEAISTLLATLVPSWKNFPYGPAVCFFIFWLINLAVVLKGIEYIRILQGISAPILLGVGLLLLGWAYHAAGGFGPMLSVPSRFVSFPDFLKFLVPALNGTVGFWATVSLNIPDFTRFARNQREQVIGQALALPTTMTLYSFVGIAVTSATVVIYGTAIWDPVQLLSRFHSPVAVVISLLAILLATLNVNIGANVVSPANDFSNLWPTKISFRTGGVITCFMGVAHDAVETAGQLRHVHLRMARRLRGIPRPGRGNHDLRLLRDPPDRAAWSTISTCAGALRIFARIQLARGHRAGAGRGHSSRGICDSIDAILYAYSWFVGFAVSFVAYLC